MSGQWNSEAQRYEVFSTLEGGMVPTGKPMDYQMQPGVDYCGYCKHGFDDQGNCVCDGLGGGHTPTCSYCHSAYDGKGNCNCDGFGNDPETGEPLPYA